ncbi:MAG: hypothetical protein NUW21_04260 [Elusimicrobia bacterium]|nr:hypothetical protein [Elusimicrobiota bacterium]
MRTVASGLCVGSMRIPPPGSGEGAGSFTAGPTPPRCGCSMVKSDGEAGIGRDSTVRSAGFGAA